MVESRGFFSDANTYIQVDYISKNSLSHSLTLCPCVNFHLLGVFSNYLGIFSLFRSIVKNQVLSSQVMRQLPSTQCLGGIKAAPGSTPESKCFISAIAHPLLVLGQWATSFLLQERQDPEIYFAFIHLLEEIHMDADVFCSNVCCLYPHFSHNLFLYVFVEVINIPLVQIRPLSLAACISIVLPQTRVLFLMM